MFFLLVGLMTHVTSPALLLSARPLATRLASQLLGSQAFRDALAQRLERLHRSGNTPGLLTGLLLEASHAASHCCRSGSCAELRLQVMMTDRRLAAAAAQLVQRLSLQGNLVGAWCSATHAPFGALGSGSCCPHGHLPQSMP
jgi:hypothetical protein